MNKFYEILLISTSVVGFYASFILLFRARQNRYLNRLLAFYSLTCSIFFLLIYAAIRGWGSEALILVRTFTPILLITPPIGYLYFRGLLADETTFSKSDVVHALPLTLNLSIFSPQLKNLWYGHALYSGQLMEGDPQIQFINPGPILDEFIITFRIAVTLIYVLLVVRCFLQKRSYLYQIQGDYIYSKSKNWIWIVLTSHVSFGGFIIINQFFILLANDPGGLSYGGLTAILALLGLNIVIIYAVSNPEILFGLPQFVRPDVVNTLADVPLPTSKPDPNHNTVANPVSAIEKTEGTPKPIVEPPPEKTEALTDPISGVGRKVDVSEAVQLLVGRIHDYVARHQPYRNQEFNIASLSQLLDVPQHHIAFIFRQVLHKSFVEYRNSLRVEHVKELIRRGKHKQITIEAIGTDAGFSSRATFFAVFKEVTGKTPGQYAVDYTADKQE